MESYEAARPLMRLWRTWELSRSRRITRPRDETFVGARGVDSVRVLLLGDVSAQGWGVASHQLALPGQLGRALRASLDRIVSVDHVGHDSMPLAAAVPYLGSRDLARDDMRLLMLGVNDAVRLTPVEQWRSSMESLLQHLRRGAAAPIAVVGIQPIRSIARFDTIGGALAQRHADRLEAITRELVEAIPEAVFVPFPSARRDAVRPHGSPELYRAWAGELTQTIAPLLADAAGGEAQPAKVYRWAGTERTIDLARSGGSLELQRIAKQAQRAFHVEVASVSIIEGEDNFYAVNTDAMPPVIPAELSRCTTVAETRSPLVIGDTRRDERFQGNPLVEMSNLNFYAGHPLYSLEGDAIGSFCIMGFRPRSEDGVRLEVLEQFALRAQQELWRIEREATGAPEPDALLTAS